MSGVARTRLRSCVAGVFAVAQTSFRPTHGHGSTHGRRGGGGEKAQGEPEKGLTFFLRVSSVYSHSVALFTAYVLV
jgi:hypothetical protein